MYNYCVGNYNEPHIAIHPSSLLIPIGWLLELAQELFKGLKRRGSEAKMYVTLLRTRPRMSWVHDMLVQTLGCTVVYSVEAGVRQLII